MNQSTTIRSVESFLGILEIELSFDQPVPRTRDEARAAIHEYTQEHYEYTQEHYEYTQEHDEASLESARGAIAQIR